jgi:hypothetical protein
VKIFFIFLLSMAVVNALKAESAIGFRSITFMEGTELRISNPELASRVMRWLENKRVAEIDYTKLGAVTPVFYVMVYKEGVADKFPIYLHYGKGVQSVGVLNDDEVMDLLLMLGLGRIWLLQEGLPRRTGDQVRQLDPGYQGK